MLFFTFINGKLREPRYSQDVTTIIHCTVVLQKCDKKSYRKAIGLKLPTYVTIILSMVSNKFQRCAATFLTTLQQQK